MSESTAALKGCVCACPKAASALSQLLYMTVSVSLEHSKELLLCLSGQPPVSLPFEGFSFLTHLFSAGEAPCSPASSPVPGSPSVASSPFFSERSPPEVPPHTHFCTCIHILFLKLFSIIGYYKILTRVPCAIQ